jgi:hypothetical protein
LPRFLEMRARNFIENDQESSRTFTWRKPKAPARQAPLFELLKGKLKPQLYFTFVLLGRTGRVQRHPGFGVV